MNYIKNYCRKRDYFFIYFRECRLVNVIFYFEFLLIYYNVQKYTKYIIGDIDNKYEIFSKIINI